MKTDSTDDAGRGELGPRLARAPLPPELRQRVMESYDRQSSRPRYRTTWAMLAAAVVVFAAGVFTGRASAASPAGNSVGPSFALLLYDAPGRDSSVDDTAEHVRWARELAARGQLVTGEKLGDEVEGVTPKPTDVTLLQGFFIVRAANAAEAMSIARSLPHVRHGGRVVVRLIDPT